jgi:hypothetical protein
VGVAFELDVERDPHPNNQASKLKIFLKFLDLS